MVVARLAYLFHRLVAGHVVSSRGKLSVHETEWQFASSPVEECWTGLKLTAIGVISCRGELYVFEFEWQFV